MQNLIPPDAAGTLYGLFRERLRRTPEAVAYRQFEADRGGWVDSSWWDMAAEVARWQAAFAREDLQPGDRVAIAHRNGREWVCFDQAALSLGLVVVPIYTRDRAENAAYILEHSGARLLLIEGGRLWRRLAPLSAELRGLARILVAAPAAGDDPRRRPLADWLPEAAHELRETGAEASDLATIPYTSGTTGRPKGVMLSHDNILRDAWSAAQPMPVRCDDLLLSFLPLSHMYERTVGYYLPMMAGAVVAYARSIPDLPEDLTTIRPTALVSVPRIYERMHERLMGGRIGSSGIGRRFLEAMVEEEGSPQGVRAWRPSPLLAPVTRAVLGRAVRRRFGGRVRVALSGGAPLAPEVQRFFLALGLPLVQGYGLTETSPVVSVNTPDDNDPESAGRPLPGVEVRIGEEDELLTRGPNVMLGYWRDEDETRRTFTDDGWLRTGDRAQIRDGRLYITGRLKQILVLATGENLPPGDLETAITSDPLFEQALIVGEGRPFLSALVVLNEDEWSGLARGRGADAESADGAEDLALQRIADDLRDFPGYAQVRRVAIAQEPWSVENGLLTPTLKPRRGEILERYRDAIERLYEGHGRSG